MATQEKKEWAVLKLRSKAEELGRTPKKDDFSETDRSKIKAFLGPWPRALETAGLKEAKITPKSKKRKSRSTSGDIK